MTLTNALLLALERIEYNNEYLARVRKHDKENPDSTEIQIGARISQLAISIVEQHNEILKDIIKEIIKDGYQKILIDLIKIQDSQNKGKRTRMTKESRQT